MPAFPSLFRPELLVLGAALFLAEDKPMADPQKPEHHSQQPASRTTTRNWANIPTPSIQPNPPRDTKNSKTENNQRKPTPKTAAAKENQQPTNPQPADNKNLPRNPTTTHSPASAKTAPQLQDHAARRGQSLVNTLCASCHSTMLVHNARKTSVDWRKTLSKMESQGMPKLPPALREPLIRYLATALGIPVRNLRQNYGPWADRRNTNPLW